jgi:hypothetical protein
MSAQTAWPKEVIRNDDIAMLRNILQDWCREQPCALSSQPAQSKAKELVGWFEFGVKDQGELRRIIRPL